MHALTANSNSEAETRVLLSALRRQCNYLNEKIEKLESTRMPRDPVLRCRRRNQLENMRADMRTCETLLKSTVTERAAIFRSLWDCWNGHIQLNLKLPTH